MVPLHLDLHFSSAPPHFSTVPFMRQLASNGFFCINLLPQLECVETTGAVQCKSCGDYADLLGQDEDLHYEYTAEYEAGTGYIVLEGWQCCGSVLLREKWQKKKLGTNLWCNSNKTC